MDAADWTRTLLEDEDRHSWARLDELIAFDWYAIELPSEPEDPQFDWWSEWLRHVNDYMIPVIATVHGPAFEAEFAVLLDAMEGLTDPNVRKNLRWAKRVVDERITTMQDRVLEMARSVRIVFGFN